MKKSFIYIISFTLLLVGCVLSSCNVTKRVPEKAKLLTENVIYVNDKENDNANIENFIRQQPNSRIFGIPFSIYFYNLASPNPEEKYWKWLDEHPKWHRFLESWLSKKQVNRLSKSFVVSGLNRQLKNIGEAPILLDSTKIKASSQTLKAYYNSIGYFNTEVSDSIILTGIKEAKVNYSVSTGPRYYLDSIATNIASKEVDSVYNLHKEKSFIKKGSPYRLLNYSKERERITSILRNNGFYSFQQSSINFKIERDTLLSQNDTLINSTTVINNLIERDGDIVTTKPYKIYKIKKVNIFADHDFTIPVSELDTITYKGYTIYYKDKLKYRPSVLVNASAIKKGQAYKDENRTYTYRQFNNLRTFKYPSVEYKPAETDTLKNELITNIYLNPLKKFGLEQTVDITHSNIQDYGLSFGTSFLTRNIFKGAETLEISARGTFASQESAKNNNQFFNISEIGGDVRLTFPRIVFFTSLDRWIPYQMTPQTSVQFSMSSQTNVGLDKLTLNGVLRYSWNPNEKHRNIVELIDGELVNNTNPDNFFNVYQSSYGKLNTIAQDYGVDDSYLNTQGNLSISDKGAINFINHVLSGNIQVNDTDKSTIRSIDERMRRITENNFILGTNYTYIHNRTNQYYEKNFSQIRLKLETVGYLPKLISSFTNLKKNENDREEIFGVAYAQYTKGEADLIKHWDIGADHVLALRAFLGIAIPYGNANSIPFSRSYFAGGSNDNRGWVAYSLGPGSSGSVNDFNEANMKLALNFEYRFPISGSFKGALFADAGNIWNVFDNVEDSASTFDHWKDLQDIALGTGFGLRYDLGFFVLRLDLGLKAYNPALPYKNRWISHIQLKDFVYNVGINYPF